MRCTSFVPPVCKTLSRSALYSISAHRSAQRPGDDQRAARAITSDSVFFLSCAPRIGMPWVPHASPPLYDCTEVNSTAASRWRMVCGPLVQSYAVPSRGVRSVSWEPGIGNEGSRLLGSRNERVARAMQLLANRTIAVMGDSLAINLFCSLMCTFVASGAELGLREAGPFFGSQVMQMRAPQGRSSFWWLLPSCARRGHGSNKCGKSHSTASQQNLQRLVGMYASSRPKAVATRTAPFERLVVLYNQPIARISALLPRVATALENTTLDEFARQSSPWDLVCRSAPEACDGTGFVLRNASASLRHTLVRTAEPLRLLRERNNNLVAIVETPPSHFPWFPGCLPNLQGSLWRDTKFGYDGLVLSALGWVHRLLQQPKGNELLSQAAPTKNGFRRPSELLRDNLMLASLLAIARRGAATCGFSTGSALLGCAALVPGGDKASCLLSKLDLKALKAAKGPPNQRPPTHGGLPLFAGPCASGRQGGSWTVEVERAVARDYGLEILNRFEPRLTRSDLHPAVQQKPPFYFDCTHSSFARGAFDAEAASFFDLLEQRFGV